MLDDLRCHDAITSRSNRSKVQRDPRPPKKRQAQLGRTQPPAVLTDLSRSIPMKQLVVRHIPSFITLQALTYGWQWTIYMFQYVSYLTDLTCLTCPLSRCLTYVKYVKSVDSGDWSVHQFFHLCRSTRLQGSFQQRCSFIHQAVGVCLSHCPKHRAFDHSELSKMFQIRTKWPSTHQISISVQKHLKFTSNLQIHLQIPVVPRHTASPGVEFGIFGASRWCPTRVSERCVTWARLEARFGHISGISMVKTRDILVDFGAGQKHKSSCIKLWVTWQSDTGDTATIGWWKIWKM